MTTMGFDSENAIVTGRPWLIADIETCPMPGCADYLIDPIEAPSNYKDPVKIAAYIEEKRKQQIADAALDIDLCEVAAIGIESPMGPTVLTRGTVDERMLVSSFWNHVRAVRNMQGNLIGFNVLHFDLLVLLRRSLYLGIEPPAISTDKYRHDGIIDLADILSFGRRDLLRSLGFYAKRLGIPHNEAVKGEDIPRLVAQGDWAAVGAHVHDDVATTKAIAERLGIIRTQPAAVAV